MCSTELPKISYNKVFQRHSDEKILVIKREFLFPEETVQGIQPVDFELYQKLIEDKGEFLWRSAMELDPSYKQIIPYLIFQYGHHYFLMQRKATSSDVRLRNKYSLGIGGHVRQQDLQNGSIIDWARREFEEEIVYEGNFTVQPIGLLNDESDFVGQVHTGFVFLLKGDSDKIAVCSELKHGKLATLQECGSVYDQLESWSKIVYRWLETSYCKYE
jgi:predicted NUDIX family phosphoesterase